jgi:3-oxoacyl-[acyl-carrier protein] reductase
MTQASVSRVAIVTGAARGIGRATALRLAGDGHDVGLIDLDEASCESVAEEIRALGRGARTVRADVSDAAAVDSAVAEIADTLGPPVILVSNAGVTRDALLFKMTDSDWDTVLGVHLRGAFLTCRAVQKYMTEVGWGRIVTISSQSALGNRGQANYAAAKAGLQGFTKTLAIELGKFGVTANAIAPGFIVTDMTADTAARLKIPFDTLQEQSAKQIPVRRVGQPRDVANVVSFLASDDASFVSGQVIYVAGGPVS